MTDRRRSYDVAPEDPPTEEELREAAAFAEHLEAPEARGKVTFAAQDDELVALANQIRALSPAVAPPRDATDAAVGRAVARAVASKHESADARPRATSGASVIAFPRGRTVATIGSLVALAASAFFIGRAQTASETASSSVPVLVQSRSTQPLFAEPFSHTPASSRIDRIARARANDLRENGFQLAMAGQTRRSR